ncbi:hypothetical protein [Merismopedia glauca]|uniref:Uncharacterized protein n=1 Tax=Merismopedia glauca CCAP 1448/3 TaxID=1296344 RepID=A0A2T1BZ51_9CYAN|nr:hypothetical protein [Merismopedia glauca]PSB01187.1 hypothetical protein C7B64_19665 [Merismopedia glauca CCAP 1448/3]
MKKKLVNIERILVSVIACFAIHSYSGNPSAIAASLTSNSTLPASSDRELLLAQSNSQVDWGPFLWDFQIVSKPTIMEVTQKGVLGETIKFLAISFIAEAKSSMLAPIYMADFYDSNGIVLWTTPVGMEPNHGDWQPGARTNCIIILPPNPQKIAAMKISRL